MHPILVFMASVLFGAVMVALSVHIIHISSEVRGSQAADERWFREAYTAAMVVTESSGKVIAGEAAELKPPAVSPGLDSDVPEEEAIETLPIVEQIAATAVAAQAEIRPGLLIPVQGVQAAQLVDSFSHGRDDGRVHNAIDIMAPEGTPVLAVDDGRLVKLFESDAGGLTIYQMDSREERVYYYAHLDDYAPGLTEGMQLKRGQVIGYVGSTGNADSDHPHLHFAILVLGEAKRWWQGTAINPYPFLVKRESP